MKFFKYHKGIKKLLIEKTHICFIQISFRLFSKLKLCDNYSKRIDLKMRNIINCEKWITKLDCVKILGIIKFKTNICSNYTIACISLPQL